MEKIQGTIDPGHVDLYNQGIIKSYYEGSKMYILALYLKEELEKTGLFEIEITRKAIKNDPSLSARGKIAINNKSKFILSLHTDAFTVATAVGVSVFRSIKNPHSKDLGILLGEAITNTMNNSTGVTRFRGCVTRLSPSGNDYYGIIRESVAKESVPYVYIIEHGFHTNMKECTYLNNDVNLRELAKAEAQVLYKYFKPLNVESYEVFVPIPGHTNAINAMNNTITTSQVNPGTYYVFSAYKNGAINITMDSSGTKPGWWINPNENKKPAIVEAEKYITIVDIPGYSNATNAMNDSTVIATIPADTYYIYGSYKNGAINITRDSTGKTPGWWINPEDNIKKKTPEEILAEIDVSNFIKLTMRWDNLPEITPEQAIAFIKSKSTTYKLTCTLEELVYDFVRAGYIENIRWDVALAQSIHETGFFKYGGQVKPEQNNYSGLGATNDGASGATFETPFIGALAQIQHLKAYANNEEISYKETVDPRFKYVTRGWAPYLEWLGAGENPKNGLYGKNIGWAVPGNSYGQSIRKIIDEIKTVKII